MGRSSMSSLKVTLPLAICLLFCLISRMDAKTLLVETQDKNNDYDYNKGDGKGKGNDNGQWTPDNDYGEDYRSRGRRGSRLFQGVKSVLQDVGTGAAEEAGAQAVGALADQANGQNDYGKDYRSRGRRRGSRLAQGVKSVLQDVGTGAAEEAGAQAVGALADQANGQNDY